MSIDIYDEVGIGGGASGVSGGLLHPYSPKVKLLWRGAECWGESLKLLSIAEAAVDSKLDSESQKFAKDDFIVRRRGILRPAAHLKHLDILRDNAQNSLASCRIEYIDESAAQILVPNLSTPLNSAFYMPQAINVHPRNYLEALFLACQNLSKDLSIGRGRKEIRLCQMSVNSLLDLEGKYNAVVVCLGARAVFLPELSVKAIRSVAPQSCQTRGSQSKDLETCIWDRHGNGTQKITQVMSLQMKPQMSSKSFSQRHVLYTPP